jgi:hypothetical protein
MSVYYPPSGPTGPPRPPMSGKWAAVGAGLALLGHLLTLLPLIVVLASGSPSDQALGSALVVALIAQGVLFLVCLVVGIVQLSKSNGNRGLGLGLLIGWALGLLVTPVVGFGLCVQALN